MSRNEFSTATKNALAKRVGYKCSNPDCHAAMVGPHAEADRWVNVGVAAHISAASPHGPRYDPSQTPEARSHRDNAIWLCQTCAKRVDSDTTTFTSSILARWKVSAETEAMRSVGNQVAEDSFPQPSAAVHAPIPRISGLPYDEARNHLLGVGWQPRLNHWTYGTNPAIAFGNGPYYWGKGYHEIRHSYGTGLAYCNFAFEDVYGNRLIVVTAGEVITEIAATACVWRWYFEKDNPSA